MIRAFAAKTPEGILINTVSDTERAAKVNWLGTEGGYTILRGASDQQINDAFRRCQLQRPPGSLEVVPVTVGEEVH